MNPESNSIASTLEEPVQLSSGACPLCGMSDTVGICEVETWSTYRIEECRDCGFVFAAPRPTPKALDDFYTSEYFRKTQNGKTGYADYRGMAEKNARRMWHELKVILRRRSIAPGKVLDVGCATGGFLAEAQAEGVDCLGVELSEYAVGVARAEFKLAVHQGDIYSPALEEQGFDLLTMWHVLEHLIEPMSTLKRAHELLAANGTLLVELPNWASVGRRVKGAGWSQLKPPEHINFFTPRTLSAAAEHAGFEVLQCTSEYPSLMNEARVLALDWPIRLAKAAAAALACRAGCGGYVRLLARKRG